MTYYERLFNINNRFPNYFNDITSIIHRHLTNTQKSNYILNITILINDDCNRIINILDTYNTTPVPYRLEVNNLIIYNHECIRNMRHIVNYIRHNQNVDLESEEFTNMLQESRHYIELFRTCLETSWNNYQGVERVRNFETTLLIPFQYININENVRNIDRQNIYNYIKNTITTCIRNRIETTDEYLINYVTNSLNNSNITINNEYLSNLVPLIRMNI